MHVASRAGIQRVRSGPGVEQEDICWYNQVSFGTMKAPEMIRDTINIGVCAPYVADL